MRVGQVDVARLTTLFNEFGFRRFIDEAKSLPAELKLASTDSPEVSAGSELTEQPARKFDVVQTETQLATLVEQLRSQREFCLEVISCRNDEEREQAIRGVSGYTSVGMARDRRMVENLRDRRAVLRAADLGIDVRLANRNLLAARSMRDLVRASGGLYRPPHKFRNW